MVKNENHDKGNVLIVDGMDVGSKYKYFLKKREYEPYSIISNTLYEFFSSNESYMNLKTYEELNSEEYVERFKENDWKSFEDMCDSLKKYNFLAVIPAQESSILLGEKLSYELGITPTNDITNPLARRDKFQMKIELQNKHIPFNPYILTDSSDDAVNWFLKNNSKSVIIKQPFGAGSANMLKCSTDKELIENFITIKNSPDTFGNVPDNLLVEQYLEGEEIIVNCASRDGKNFLDQILTHRKKIVDGKHIVYDVDVLHYRLNKKYKKVIEYVYDVMDALGVKVGATHNEVILTSEGQPLLLETAARIPGTVPQLAEYKKVMGYESYDVVLDSYLDPIQHEKNVKKEYSPLLHFCVKLLISPLDTDIVNIPAKNLLPHIPSVGTVNVSSAELNMHLSKTINLLTPAGIVALSGADKNQVELGYRVLRFLEEKHFNLLFTTIHSKPLTKEEEKIKKDIESGIMPIEQIEQFEEDYNLNSSLDVL
jgi:hypothetical protein